MNLDELRAAIENPAGKTWCGDRRRLGLIVFLILLAVKPGHLPLLEFALTETLEKNKGMGALTHAAYDNIGGCRESIDSSC